MPDTASTTAAAAADNAGQPAPRARSRSTAASRRTADKMPLQTLAQFMDADYEPRGHADDVRMTRSFHLRTGVVERARAASTGVQHKAYDTQIADEIPKSFSAFVEEAIISACRYYEQLLNGGKEFTRTGRLSPGPTREGAARGAEKRRLAREAAASAESET